MDAQWSGAPLDNGGKDSAQPPNTHYPNLGAAIGGEYPLPTRLFRRMVPDLQIAAIGPFVDEERQQFRYRALPTDMTDTKFQTLIKDINTKVTGGTAGFLTKRDAAREYMDGRRSHTYPLPADRLAVLAHGLRLADAAPPMAKYLLPAAVVTAHPFSDGNGRTSRVLHALLSGLSSTDISRMRIADQHTPQEADARARELVCLGMPYQLHPFVEERALELMGVPPVLATVLSPNIDDAITMLRFSAQEHRQMVLDFSTVYSVQTSTLLPGERLGITSDDFPTLDLAGARLAHHIGVDPLRLDIAAAIASGRCTVGQFVGYIWDARKQFALATLDCLGDNTFANRIVTIDEQTQSIRAHYLQLSNHLG